jgi:UDP-glucose 4-epimerase
MNLLITGVCGHIGSYLLENINKIKKINKIYLIDNLENEKASSLFKIKSKKKIYFFLRDLKNKKALTDIKNVDIVIHLASITNAAASFVKKKKLYENNLGCFNNVINFCIKSRAKLIHISSTSIYGKAKGIVHEDSGIKDINPQSPYAEVKFLEENILKKNSKKIKFTSFRFGTIVGPSKGMRFHTAVNNFCLRATINDYINIYKTAKNQYRPYLSIRDSFKVFKFCIEKNFFKNDIFNALSGNFTTYEILNKIKKIKKKIKIKYVNSPIMNQLSYHVDKNKLSKSGLILNSNLDIDIKKTIKLLNYLQ